ncbi:MAG: hypothetical protein IT304_09030 [Dehalococcoidia bacterium]|nr:hypothetical protein [Dehalococcoidia bacterium]
MSDTYPLTIEIPVSAIPDLVRGFGHDLMDAIDPALRDATSRAATGQATTGQEQHDLAVAWFARRGYDLLLDLKAQEAAQAVRSNPGIPWSRP